MATNGVVLGFRRLARRSSFSLPTTITLAIGLATVLAIYGPLQSIVLRPLPYPEPDRLLRVWLDVPGLGEGQLWGLSKASLEHFAGSDSLEAMALYNFGSAMLKAPGADQVLAVGTAEVSASLFDVLRVPLALGRAMDRAENLRSEESGARLLTPIWISDRLWRTRFGADEDILGRVLELSGEPAEIAGVLSPHGRFPEELADASFDVDIWRPLALGPTSGRYGSHVYRAVARLASGADARSAKAQLNAIIAGLPEASPSVYSEKLLSSTRMEPALTALKEDVVGPARQLLLILFVAVLLVLVMALTNVGNLMAAYAEHTRHETEVRTALGATPMRARAAFLLDVTLMSVIAGLVAYGLARWALESSLALMGPEVLPRFDEIGLPIQVLAGSLMLSLVLTLPIALLVVSRRGFSPSALRATGTARASRGLAVARRALVAVQIAISVALLAGALLLLRTSSNLQQVDLGFRTAGITHLEVILSEETYSGLGPIAEGYRRLAHGIGEMPGVESASLAAHIPLLGMDGCSAIYDAAGPVPSAETALCFPVFLVSPGYFETLEIPLQGRPMTWADQDARAPVAVASRALAERLWPELGAPEVLEQAVLTGPGSPAYRIVGIAENIRAVGVDQPVSEILYLPMVPATGDDSWGAIHAVMLSVASSAPLAPGQLSEIRNIVRAQDSQGAVLETRTMQELADLSLAQTRLLTRLVGLACLSALLLGAFGIYAVLAYLITARRAELGVRMALGAGRREIYRLVIGEALHLAALGVSLGLAITFVLGGRIQHWLFGISSHDPLTLAMVSLLALVAVALAALIPAYRAARLPLATMLRQSVFDS